KPTLVEAKGLLLPFKSKTNSNPKHIFPFQSLSRFNKPALAVLGQHYCLLIPHFENVIPSVLLYLQTFLLSRE
uniref:Uncharacterized protein n=1 Tax=Anas zonorhyncha TaxID=75864 RepID=A0A8B9W3V4_9AVES